VKSDSHVGGGPLEEIVRREILSRGPMTFARFMELALYHPEHGYYASGRARIGRKGDFFTNVSVGPVFGRLLAAEFLEIWEKLDRPRPFTIVEQGAHEGQFATDVLSALTRSDCFGALKYVIIEPFPVWRKRQEETLARFRDKISWFESTDQLEPFTGIHFSNELFDALPVHLLEWDGSDWNELFVSLPGDEFEFQRRTCSGGLRPPGATVTDRRYRTQVSLAAPKLMRGIAAKLSCGVILTIDYGFTREEYYSLARSAGTLQVRAQHRKLSSPFEQIGLVDISAHVEWTSLIKAAQESGATLIGLTDQHHFLTGILSELLPPATMEEFSAAEKRSLQTLVHPEMLGRTFQALAVAKNFNKPLSGFHFARRLS
jgi:SAM-dependent MidA family methyltransferase